MSGQLVKLLIVEQDIPVQRGLQFFAGTEVVALQHLFDAAVEALDHAVGLRMLRRGGAVFDINRHKQKAPRVRRENCPPDSFLIRFTISHLRQILDVHVQIAGLIGLERLVLGPG